MTKIFGQYDGTLCKQDACRELCGVALTVDFTVGGAHDFTQYEVSIMANGKLSELSMDFAVSILNLCDGIKGHSSLVNQL